IVTAQAAAAAYEERFEIAQQLRNELPESQKADWDKNVLDPTHYYKADWAQTIALCEAQKAQAIALAAGDKAQKLAPSDADFEPSWAEAIVTAKAAAAAYERHFEIAQQLRGELPESKKADWDKNTIHPALTRSETARAETIALTTHYDLQKIASDDPGFLMVQSEASAAAAQASEGWERVLAYREEFRNKAPEGERAHWDRSVEEATTKQTYWRQQQVKEVGAVLKNSN
ncbi:MAG: hypothetical protein ACH346_07875, partial [Chthoniobacterales bacterium]